MSEAENDIEQYDGRSTYCRMLGHQITFGYCRKPGRELFCSRIRDCWTGKIEIDEYIQKFFSPEEIAQALKPAVPKVASLLELIKKAQGT